VLRSGVRRVVVATPDPFPAVAGQGLARLREAGIEVEVGVLAGEARHLNRAFFKVVRTGRPWVMLKMAMTLDGKSATRTGDSRWISSEPSRRLVHHLRNAADAVLIGAGTAWIDNPRLTARLPGGRNPVRVVVSSRGNLPPEGFLAQTAGEIRTLVTARPDALPGLPPDSAVEVVPIPARGDGVDLDACLKSLAERDLHLVLCEGGGALAGALLDAGLVDEVVWFVAPVLAGGAAAPGPVGGHGVETMAAATRLRKVRVRRLGGDLVVRGLLREPG
jgi:diaminohydroxyphosphoribosylaminopyrimidine deaminase / 5-amino-6-(5-phosphoribosylamino)uracil reductase